jgi:hypothetical protein
VFHDECLHPRVCFFLSLSLSLTVARSLSLFAFLLVGFTGRRVVFAGSPSSAEFPDPPTPAASFDPPDLIATMIALLERTQEAHRVPMQRFCIKLLHCIELVAMEVAQAHDGGSSFCDCCVTV